MTTINKPLLSICIPTYNRCPDLIAALTTIESQLENRIEIVISDNCSTDTNVHSTIHAFQKRLPLRYQQQPFNCGAEENVMRVASYARGEYLLIHGSDDRLAPGALKTIVDLLRTQQPDLLCFGYSTINGRTRIDIHPRRERLLLHPNCQEAFDDFPDLSCSLMFISSFVVRTNRWRTMDGYDDPTWLGSQYRHTCRLHALINNGNIQSLLTHPQSLIEAASADFDIHRPEPEHSSTTTRSQPDNQQGFDQSLLYYDANLMLLLSSSVYRGWQQFPSGLLASFRRSHSVRKLQLEALSRGQPYIRAYNETIRTIPLGLRYKFLLTAICYLAAEPLLLRITVAMVTALAQARAFTRAATTKLA